MLHNLRNKIKANTKSVYSDLRGGGHGYPCLVITDLQFTLISPTIFVYPTHPGPLIVPDRTTDHAKPNIRILHTEEVNLFREVTGVEKALVQQIFGTVEESYLANIRNRTTNSISSESLDRN